MARGEHLTQAQLRSFLKAKLPDYMLPSSLCYLPGLPLTPNGKVDRKALAELAQQQQQGGRSEAVEGARSDSERVLARIWEQVLGLKEVSINDNFFELGGDSILSIQVVAKAARQGLRLSARQVFEHQTIAELAEAAEAGGEVEAEQGMVSGEVELTPIQRRYFGHVRADVNRYNQAVLLRVRDEVDWGAMKRAVEGLVSHHDALRMSYEQEGGRWRQYNRAEASGGEYVEVDLEEVSEERRREEVEKVAGQLQRSLSITEGPVMRVAGMRLRGGESRVQVMAHHLVIDGVSWRIVLEDLQAGYRQASRGEEVKLGKKTTSFRRWAEQMSRYGRGEQVMGEQEYWARQESEGVKRVRVDREGGANEVGSERNVVIELGEEETRRLLQESSRRYRAQINEVLISGLARAVGEWVGGEKVRVEVEGHGREEIVEGVDVSRTVGWFTVTYPVEVEVERGSRGRQLKRVKERLRGVPGGGIGYGLTRHMVSEAEGRVGARREEEAEVSFNYLGQMDQMLGEGSRMEVAEESVGEGRDRREERNSLIEVNGAVRGGRLRMRVSYSEQVHEERSIRELAESYKRELEWLIEGGEEQEAEAFTPSDFPMAHLTQEELDNITGHLNQNGQKAIDYLEDLYRLSPAQKGLLFHSLYSPGSGVYFEQFTCTIKGELDIIAFTAAWQQLLDRHAILRTSFLWSELVEPVQVVHRRVELPLEQQDWRALSPADQQARLSTYREQTQRSGFSLSESPPISLALFRLADDTHQFVWSHHHILLDGWSTPHLLRELFLFYEAFCRGEQPRLERPRPFRDYIAWLQRQDLSKAERFWREMLRGVKGPTPLGGDSGDTSTTVEHESYCEDQTYLTAEATAALYSFTQQHQLTAHTLIQAAWAFLLSHYSSEEDVVFGNVVSGRPPELAGVESMVGLFVNTLPVRVRLPGEALLLTWLKQLQQQQAEYLQYEYSPLLDIQGWSEVPRGVPLFNSILAFANYPSQKTERKQTVAVQFRDIESVEKTNYPLTVGVIPGTQMLLRIIYNSQRFDPDTVTQMLSDFKTALEEMIADPYRRLRDIPLRSERPGHYLDNAPPLPAGDELEQFNF